jgi:hypothetical protein
MHRSIYDELDFQGTKEIRLNTNLTNPFKIYGENINTGPDICYLGSNVSADGGGPKDQQSQSCIFEAQEYMESKQYPQ